MKNRNPTEDALPTPKGEENFLGFVTSIDIRLLMKTLRVQFLFYAKQNASVGYPCDWPEMLHELDCLFDFLDGVESEYF